MTEAERYTKSWQDRSLRMAAFKTVQIAGVLVIFGSVYLTSRHPTESPWKSPRLALPVWFTTYMLMAVWLDRFRCPRCRRFFIGTLDSREPLNATEIGEIVAMVFSRRTQSLQAPEI